MKYPWGEKDIDYWYLFMDCKSRNMLALLGTTKQRIDEAESKRILEPWLTPLNITEFGIEDFDYSSGMCNHIYLGTCGLAQERYKEQRFAVPKERCTDCSTENGTFHRARYEGTFLRARDEGTFH